MKRLSMIPESLRQAIIDGQKPDRFFGAQQDLRKSRKRSNAQQRQTFAVKRVLKTLGL